MTEGNTKVNTPEFRAAFPNVFVPRRNELSQADEYSVVALFAPGADLAALKAAARAAVIKKWGADQSKWPPNLKSPFRDQGERKKQNDAGQWVLPDGYAEGAIFINLKSKQKPGVVNQNVEEIIDSSEFYGGCYARASVNAYAYDQKGNKGVAFGLGNIQKIKDGDPFGNRTKPQDDFQPVANPDATAAASAPAADMFS